MKRVYLVPNIITAFALACGLFVIFKINMLEPGTGDYEVVQTSTFLLLLAAFADFIDGALARAIHAESEFGVIFDSLADAISFGVAPSVLMLKVLSLEQGTSLSFISATAAMVFSVCGVLRLARFNVKTAEAKAQPELGADQKRHFTGLPIPAAAAAAVWSAIRISNSVPLNYECIFCHMHRCANNIFVPLTKYIYSQLQWRNGCRLSI